MKRSSGARMYAAVAVTALSFALVSGCSDGGGKDAKGSGGSSPSPGGSSAPASSSAPPAEALTTAELQKLLLAEGDVKGYKTGNGKDTLPKGKSTVKADKAACTPLAYAMAALAPGDTDAVARNLVTEDTPAATKDPDQLSDDDWASAMDRDVTLVGLSSYGGDGAAKTFKAVSDAVENCSGGFGVTADGEQQKITRIAPEKATGAGDESLAFTVDASVDGSTTATAAFHTEVVRKGSVVATFYTINFTAMTSGKAYSVPAAVVEAQAAKLP
ncbi:hypothetical protein ACL02U_30115 [Streptomyces sp. MS06]|uniref:hypothetical protein n=1 Tax=Streptomyces sp. MS06 TaxID=3385974 RepID=UPI0039A089CD